MNSSKEENALKVSNYLTYKPLDEIEHTIKEKFGETLKGTINTGLSHGFLLCENDKKNLAIGTSCTGRECHEKKPTCPPGWKRRIAVMTYYQI